MFFILLISLVSLVKAEDVICPTDDLVAPNESCRMVTPFLTCGIYTYDIYNKNGSVLIEQGNLTNIADGFYYFNFTNKSEGTYLVKLCDDSSRIVFVERSEVSQMAIELSVIFSVIAIIGILLYIAFKLDEEHWALKFLFISFSIFMTLLIPRALYYFEPIPFLEQLVKYTTRITYVFVIYIFIYFIWKIAEYYDKLIPIKRFFNDKMGNKNKKD